MVLVIVSIAGVCGFVLPNRDLANAVRIWRFAIGVMGTLLGGWGVVLGAAALLVHLGRLKCLEVPYLTPYPGGRGILRRRLKDEKYRDEALNPEDRKNQK